MKICIASHVALDEIIDLRGEKTESLGGPVCYGSLLAKTFNFSTFAATRVGNDMVRKLQLLRDCNIFLTENQIDKSNPTTKFRLILNKDSGRQLYLLSSCSEIKVNDFVDSDALLLSPIFEEISQDTLRKVVDNYGDRFIMIDPQGFLRYENSEGLILNRKRIDLDLKGVTAIKADPEELSALTGGTASIEGMIKLRDKFNLEFVISTGSNSIIFLHKNIVYTIKFKKIDSPDHTGLGDILATGFTCAYLKERDPLWAICFGAGSVISSLESKKTGVQKVPERMNLIERFASYFYNTVNFKVVD
jgi:sugar/nucleoside kinase (ribokinase family)